MSNLAEETHTTCRCKSGTVPPGKKVCPGCESEHKKKAKDYGEYWAKNNKIDEMGMAGGTGVQLPLGEKSSCKESFDRMIKEAGDINEAQTVVFLKTLTPPQMTEVLAALEIGNHDFVASLVREHVIREAVRHKIKEVVRKKAGGGGYTLYAPNRGKKHGAKALGTFPTKLAAKRAELARFPPKDPGKLQRLRKEVEKLMKDPKKAAAAERRAHGTKGTDGGGKSRGKKKYESKILAKILVNEVRKRTMTEGLFREDAQPSEWDEFIKKASGAAMEGDKGFQRVMRKLDAEMQTTFQKSMRLVANKLKGIANVKSLGMKANKDSGQKYMAFQVDTEAASVGPIYIFAEYGVPKIELSDKAEEAFGGVDQELGTRIRGALGSTETELRNMGGLRDLITQRDAYLSSLEEKADGMISGMSPLQLSMLKRLLVKKYRGAK